MHEYKTIKSYIVKNGNSTLSQQIQVTGTSGQTLRITYILQNIDLFVIIKVCCIIITSWYPLRGKSSVCMMHLKYRIIIYRVYFKHTTHTSSNFSILNQHFSSCEGNNSHRHFDLLIFRRFNSICRRYNPSYSHSGCRRVAGDQLSIVTVQVVAISTSRW